MKATVDLTIVKWGLVIRGAVWCENGGREWIAFPAKEWIDGSGSRKFSNVLEFADRETAERLQGAALAAAHAIAETL
jgi:hypothetical protein